MVLLQPLVNAAREVNLLVPVCLVGEVNNHFVLHWCFQVDLVCPKSAVVALGDLHISVRSEAHLKLEVDAGGTVFEVTHIERVFAAHASVHEGQVGRIFLASVGIGVPVVLIECAGVAVVVLRGRVVLEEVVQRDLALLLVLLLVPRPPPNERMHCGSKQNQDQKGALQRG